MKRAAPPAASATPAVPAAPQAPDSFRVALETTKGRIVVEIKRAWCPLGVDRFHQLVSENYFTDVRFFRVLPGFVAQFGMHGDPATHAKWSRADLPDEPVTNSNRRGTLTFATAGPNTRSNQFFINLADNANLDAMGFTPIGRVVEGMKVVDQINAEYGETPHQGLIERSGNEYLTREFPRLDAIKSAKVLDGK